MSRPIAVTERRVVALLALLALSGCTQAATTSAPTPAPAPSAASLVVTPTSPLKDFGTMWTFDAPPLAYWKARYGFDAPKEWLDHVRLSSVRIPGCSASIVSPDGLVMTNHHCARACTTESSARDSNYIETGFVAAALNDEKKCRGMTADQLQSIEDVSARVQGALTAPDAKGQAEQRATVTTAIQQECQSRTGLTCQVVSFYQGGRYSLYRFKRYADVRLVMAPEEGIAFFGGDPDNFTFPRFDLDLTLLRIYENDAPLKAPHYLKWSASGAQEGEPVFVVGNPGTTGRLNTLAQLHYLRDVQYPNQLDQLARQRAALELLVAAGGAEEKKRYQDAIFSISNSLKAVTGYRSGLLDSTLMAKKAAFERDFRSRVNANTDTRAKFGGAWDAIAAANAERATFAREARFHGATGSQLLNLVLSIVRVPVEEPKADSLRLPAMRGNAIASLKASAGRPLPFDWAQEEALLTAQWEAALATLGRSDPFVVAAMGNGSPAQAVKALFASTKMKDPAARKALVDGGATALAASTDPMVVLARSIDPLNRAHVVRTTVLMATLSANAEKLGQAIYAAYGTMLPPDATFTLRISDGVVKGYPMNGTIAPYKTSFYGLYGRAAEFDGKPPFALPERWQERRTRLDMSTPLNFVSTNDIIGGNSGSPVVNRAGEVVGLVFDGNIQQLPNNFLFTDEVARTVSVHSRAITAALRAIYDAGRLADELEGKKP